MDWAAEARGAAALLGVYAASYVASAAVPARITPGYVIDPATGARQLYKLSAFRCLVALVAVAVSSVYLGLVPGDFFYTHHWQCVRASCALGLLLSAAFFIHGRTLLKRGAIDRRARCLTTDVPIGGPRDSTAEFDSRSALSHFYCGLSQFNPHGPLGVDVKMWLYLVGAVQLQLNLMSTVYAAAGGRLDALLASPALLAYAGCLTFFVFEYCFFEEVHTYTYDIFRERIGFKLVWGCTCFYPFFYGIGALPFAGGAGALMTRPFGCDGVSATLCCLLFATGWLLTRGASESWWRSLWRSVATPPSPLPPPPPADLQKFACKTGARTFAGGLVPMTTLPGSSGRILVAGFWGVSRHVNYAGEILQALALALPGVLATGSPLPLLYPAYYVALFVPRAADDDAMCAAKYGPELWGEYVRRVPWRILPLVW